MNGSQVASALTAAVTAVLDLITVFVPTALTPPEKTAIVGTLTAIAPLAVLAWAYFHHSAAVAKAQK